MRTTIELTDESHEAVRAVARTRGERGLSPTIQIAVDLYLASLGAEQERAILDLRGAWSEEEADSVASVMEETRSSWRSPAS